MTRSLSRSRAFSLIEVLIVIVIVSFLAAVALPYFSDATIKTHRSNGITRMQQEAVTLRQRYAISKSFLDSTNAPLSGSVAAPADQFGGVFILMVDIPDKDHFNLSLRVDSTYNGATPTPNTSLGSRVKAQNCFAIGLTQAGAQVVYAQDMSASVALSADNRSCWY
jgi:prepilin-type N-terminal cleavage/methylation domain-containing protein